jgi:quinol monooxygenase YgiN
MTTMLLTCRVADYEAWRPRYDVAIEHTPEVRSWQVWRDQDDPNAVVITETYDSRADAERLLASEEIKDLMVADGVDVASVQVRFLDEDGSGSR